MWCFKLDDFNLYDAMPISDDVAMGFACEAPFKAIGGEQYFGDYSQKVSQGACVFILSYYC